VRAIDGRALLIGAGAAGAVVLAGAACAQTQPPPAPPPSQVYVPGSASAAAAAAGGQVGVALEAGMLVRDPSGQVIGSITEVGRTPSGTPAAVIDVGGTEVGVPAGTLTPLPGNQATSSQTQAQIMATASVGLR
jgi:hypothetical protein